MPSDPAEAEGAESRKAAPAPSKPAPTKLAYHAGVRCLRGGGGGDPVIVGPMYRVGGGYVCEEKATEEEKANGPVEPATLYGRPVEGFDLRGWEAADIQGLRGADGTLNLACAILCGVDLNKAQLQGANLFHAQLQGANLYGAQLQGAHLVEARLQGANLMDAHLQGACLYEAQLQGALLRRADLSVLLKGFPLAKQGVAGETEETKEDCPTRLAGANLSVLPKGSKYSVLSAGGHQVKVSDAARPTNLADAKASGADFSSADLSGATFTDATLKDASLKQATFTALQPPERAASGALHGAWRGKALLGSVARAAIAVADDDGGGGDESNDGEEEESPVKAKMEEAIDAAMDRLAAAAQTLMRTLDGMVERVEELLRSSLLKSGKGALPTSSASALGPDRILAELLCTKLETATDKEVAIFQTLSTHVISPLFEQHLPKVLEDARSGLPSQTDDQAGAALLEQLLATFTERALDAGKVALLMRLSPIVSHAVEAGYSHPKPKPMPCDLDTALSTNSPSEARTPLTPNRTQEHQERRGQAQQRTTKRRRCCCCSLGRSQTALCRKFGRRCVLCLRHRRATVALVLYSHRNSPHN